MASRKQRTSVRKTDKALLCPLCQGRYNKPKLLSCIHTFCERCINDHVNKTAKSGHFSCPLCKTYVHVSEIKDNVFLRNYVAERMPEDSHPACDLCCLDGEKKKAISMCVQCSDNLCQLCATGHKKSRMTRAHQVIRLADVKDGKFSDQIRSNQKAFCDVHPDMQIEFFCDQCETLVCSLCRSLDHKRHNVMNISEAANNVTKQIQYLIEPTYHKLESIQSVVGETENVKTYVQKERIWLSNKVEEYFNEVRKLVNEKERSFLEKLSSDSLTFKNQLDTRLEDARFEQVSVENVTQYISRLLDKGTDFEKLQHFKDLKSHISQINRMNIPTKVEVPRFSMKFVTRPEMMIDLITHEMGDAGYLDPHRPQRIFSDRDDDKDIDHHDVGEPAQPMMDYLDSPRILNRAKLIRSFNSRLVGQTESECFGIYVNRDRYFITDFENQMVKVFHKCGTFQCYLDRGKHKLDVSGNGDDDIYVTDNESKGLVIYDKNFRIKHEIKNVFQAGGRLTCDQNRVIIADWFKNGKLIVTDMVGNEKTIIDKASLGLSQFRPYYVASGPNGHIIATDWNSKCVYILNKSGSSVLHTYRPQGRLSLIDPWGVCCDEWGNVIVADSNYGNPGCLHVMSHDGEHICVLVTREDGLEDPTGVTISGPGEVAVVEVRGMVKIYKYMDIED